MRLHEVSGVARPVGLQSGVASCRLKSTTNHRACFTDTSIRPTVLYFTLLCCGSACVCRSGELKEFKRNEADDVFKGYGDVGFFTASEQVWVVIFLSFRMPLP